VARLHRQQHSLPRHAAGGAGGHVTGHGTEGRGGVGAVLAHVDEYVWAEERVGARAVGAGVSTAQPGAEGL
jgi:hypothetical protein